MDHGVAVALTTTSSSTRIDDDLDDHQVPTAPVWVWIGLSLIAAASFWCQAVVTEERFVPALNVIADQFNIPDDSTYAYVRSLVRSFACLFARSLVRLT